MEGVMVMGEGVMDGRAKGVCVCGRFDGRQKG